MRHSLLSKNKQWNNFGLHLYGFIIRLHIRLLIIVQNPFEGTFDWAVYRGAFRARFHLQLTISLDHHNRHSAVHFQKLSGCQAGLSGWILGVFEWWKGQTNGGQLIDGVWQKFFPLFLIIQISFGKHFWETHFCLDNCIFNKLSVMLSFNVCMRHWNQFLQAGFRKQGNNLKTYNNVS